MKLRLSAGAAPKLPRRQGSRQGEAASGSLALGRFLGSTGCIPLLQQLCTCLFPGVTYGSLALQFARAAEFARVTERAAKAANPA